MGGYGSGRWGTRKVGAKTLVEDCRVLDLNRLVKEKLLRPEVWNSGRWIWSQGGTEVASICYEAQTWADSGALRLFYTAGRGEDRKSLDYRIPLLTTLLPSGGRRWWFRCVASRDDGPTCGRRVGKLYLPPEGRVFACRRCYDLAYTSNRESHKRDSLFRKLAASTGFSFETVKRTMMDWE